MRPPVSNRERLSRAVEGAILALGAPLGWLGIRVLVGFPLAAELAGHAWLYLYMWLGTTVAFSLFGYVIGKHEDLLEYLSLTDALTGLHNVRYFHARLHEEVHLARRNRHSLALMVIDLDRFKAINDRFGHPTGDRLLVRVGAALAEVVRKGETAARVGGEEFGLLLPSCADEQALQVAERLRHAIERTVVHHQDHEGQDIRVTTSIGIATTERFPELDAMELYAQADGALYEAKRLGKNCVFVAGGSRTPQRRESPQGDTGGT